MKKGILQLVAAVAVSVSTYGQTTVWNPAANPDGTGNWNEAANWTEGIPNPGSGKAVFNVEDAAPCLITDTQEVFQMVAGDNGIASEIIVKNGGTLTTGDVWSGVGYNNVATISVETGGSLTFGQHMWVGFLAGAEGTVNVKGGTVSVLQMTGLGWEGGIGKVYVSDGLLDLANINAVDMKSIGEGSLIDVSGGGLITINGNRLAHTGEDNVEYEDQLKPFIEAGRLTALGGNGDVIYWYNEDADETYIVAPTLVESTFPADASTEVSRDADVQIVFTKAMDQASVADNITITPEIENQAMVWSTSGDSLTITGDLKDGVTYAISVSKSAKDIYGYELAFDESLSFTIEGDVLLNAGQNLQDQLVAYPNPTADFISFNKGMASEVKVYDATGRLMLQEYNVAKVNVQSLQSGTYLVKAIVNGDAFTRRILVK